MLEEQKYFLRYINVGEIEILKKPNCWRNRNVGKKTKCWKKIIKCWRNRNIQKKTKCLRNRNVIKKRNVGKKMKCWRNRNV